MNKSTLSFHSLAYVDVFLDLQDGVTMRRFKMGANILHRPQLDVVGAASHQQDVLMQFLELRRVVSAHVQKEKLESIRKSRRA